MLNRFCTFNITWLECRILQVLKVALTGSQGIFLNQVIYFASSGLCISSKGVISDSTWNVLVFSVPPKILLNASNLNYELSIKIRLSQIWVLVINKKWSWRRNYVLECSIIVCACSCLQQCEFFHYSKVPNSSLHPLINFRKFFGPPFINIAAFFVFELKCKSGLMGEGFMGGGVHPPLYDLFWFPTSFFKIWKRFFASVIKIISGIYG